jgi:GLPGLI family protein
MRYFTRILAFLAVQCFATVVAFAQEGVISYEVKINLHRRIPPEREQMKLQIPEYNVQKMELYFTPDASLFQPVEEDIAEVAATGGQGGGFRMMMRPQNKVYLNLKEGMVTEQRDFMGKKFVIADTLRAPGWKLAEGQKTIKGYVCNKAVLEITERGRELSVVAWYTDAIFSMSGPDRFHSLPGTVLEVDVNDGELVTTAVNIALRPLKKNELKVPGEGKKVTREEFATMVEERMKEMGGGGGRFRMNE